MCNKYNLGFRMLSMEVTQLGNESSVFIFKRALRPDCDRQSSATLILAHHAVSLCFRFNFMKESNNPYLHHQIIVGLHGDNTCKMLSIVTIIYQGLLFCLTWYFSTIPILILLSLLLILDTATMHTSDLLTLPFKNLLPPPAPKK